MMAHPAPSPDDLVESTWALTILAGDWVKTLTQLKSEIAMTLQFGIYYVDDTAGRII